MGNSNEEEVDLQDIQDICDAICRQSKSISEGANNVSALYANTLELINTMLSNIVEIAQPITREDEGLLNSIVEGKE